MSVQPALSDRVHAERIPDLLHPTRMVRVDLESVLHALRFAFATGGTDVPLYECLDQTYLAFSTFTPECFEEDLYLDAFMTQYIVFDVRGQRHEARPAPLRRLLSHPPADPNVARFRQDVLRELSTVPELRESFQQVYLTISRFRSLLGDSGLGERLDVNRRRIDILEAARDTIEELVRGFGSATSGLSRLSEFGLSVQASEGYKRLKSVLEFEQGLASLDARLQVGYDGQLRNFEIVRVSEATANPFYATRLGRLARKFMMLVRGYRFSDAEVLGRFVDEVFAGVDTELAKFFQLLSDMEFYLTALGFQDRCAQEKLTVCLPTIQVTNNAGSLPRDWVDIFNPLLLRPGVRPVPCTLSQAAHDDIVIVTGPNSGGKTRLQQAISLAQLLGQNGVFVPASRASLVWAHAMFLSIADHSDAHQKEGRLGTELLRIRKVFESLRMGAFVVVDELCSGTNPSEGEEIFRMVLSLLRELSPQAFISTHFLQFAARLLAEGNQGLCFLQVELDAREQPTYQFVPGVATTSLAQRTAARLGVTREELLALVNQHRRSHLGATSPAAPSRAVKNGTAARS